ncbi:hypothetical protein [Nitrospirillum sp. BR 11828]|uniref:hypothetical protein n=1 Tax=Nitrospirillum sp. BR 11828 TaxID=3104325 RepID=UPI002ACA617D|nr:hypothetical protein [Nitrospirillum sp. BR 11828]MDZ5646983.1 hypothetical protein [Nitrospirillum sp. BR 11828]
MRTVELVGSIGEMMLQKRILVEADNNTWPNPGPPHFPVTFPVAPASYQLNVLSMLMVLGYITTPINALGISLSEHWAWVRYVNAIANNDYLQITSAFAQLDAHQKTILSDDFGVALPITWLVDSLGVSEICDGAYFALNLAHRHSATVKGGGKRGPAKRPDFVCKDASGLWHVVECKGTQGSEATRERQLYHQLPNGTPNGAKIQKSMITFNGPSAGQRLGTGLLIGIEGSGKNSSLKIIDPESRKPFIITDKMMSDTDDPMIRSAAGRALNALGLPTAATSFTSPHGMIEREVFRGKEFSYLFPQDEQIKRRDAIANEELDAAISRKTVSIRGASYIVREQSILLPAPAYLTGKPIKRARIRFFLEKDTLDRIKKSKFTENPIHGKDDDWDKSRKGIFFSGDDRSGQLSIGEMFLAEMDVR